MRPGLRIRILSGFAVGAMLVVGFGAPSVMQTDATFDDSEYGASPSAPALTALRLVAPQIEPAGVTCPNPLSTLLGGTALTVKWRWPSNSSVYQAATPPKVLLSSGATPGHEVAAGAPVAGVYTTSVSKGVLDGLLGGVGFLLGGGQYTLEMATVWTTSGGAKWTSTQSSKITVTYAALLAGGGATCTFVNGS